MMRMGEELGIPTPYNEYTYHMIKALEEKNDGLFDYQGERDKTNNGLSSSFMVSSMINCAASVMGSL